MSAARQERIRELAGAAGQATPSVTIHPDNLASDFGSLSFGERNLRQHLPKNAFKALKKALDAGTEIGTFRLFVFFFLQLFFFFKVY